MGFFNFGKKREQAQQAAETADPQQAAGSADDKQTADCADDKQTTDCADDKQVIDAPKAGDEWLASFEQYPKLDWETGLSYCGGDEDFYREMLGEFCNSGCEQLIADAFAAQDWKAYQINVHALKGTALTIGAIRMHEVAKAVDLANKQADVAFAAAHHAAMMEEVARTYAYLQDYLVK